MYQLFLEFSQGFVACSHRLFEFTHQWRIKAGGDDSGSIKSRSLEDASDEAPWKSAQWHGAKFFQTLRLKVAVCLLVLALPQ